MKRIIVACDGTGQSASRGDDHIPTNVTRFCRALCDTANTQQIIFYQSGIGTQDLGLAVGTVCQALGSGIEDNIADGYTFIMNNYRPGDEIFIFGFSRGAFTARVLANIIARLGIIVKPYAWTFKDAMKAYKNGKLDEFEVKKRKPISETLDFEKEAFTPWTYDVEIEVVGCWDTVASLGVPWNPLANAGGVTGDYSHFDGSLVKGIKRAYHALALDECRGPFTPTMWYLPEDLKESIDLQQCWFPGVHTNVGGGYPDRALANLTLAWMIDKCGTLLEFDVDYFSRIVQFDRQPEMWPLKGLDPGGRKDGKGENAFDEVYQGWGRGMWYDSYNNGQTWTWNYRTPGAYKGGEMKETMHASVRERWQTSREKGRGLTTGPAVWKPEALNGFKIEKVDEKWKWVRVEDTGSTWQKTKDGVSSLWQPAQGSKEKVMRKQIEIPEHPFPSGYIEGKFEWMLREGGVSHPAPTTYTVPPPNELEGDS